MIARLAAATLALALAGCAGEVAWPKTAGETTCREWSGEMSAVQREALGAAMLIALRESDGGTVRPPNEVLSAYASAIDDVCETTPDENVAAVGATIYTLSDDLQP